MAAMLTRQRLIWKNCLQRTYFSSVHRSPAAAGLHRRNPRLVILSALLPLAALLLAAPAAATDLDDSIYRNSALGVKLLVPDGWTLYQHTGYPSLLASLVGPRGEGTITLSEGRLRTGQKVEAFLREQVKGLDAVSIRSEQPRKLIAAAAVVWELAAETKDGATAIRQLHIESRGQVFTLTLCCPAARADSYIPELQRTFATLALEKAE